MTNLIKSALLLTGLFLTTETELLAQTNDLRITGHPKLDQMIQSVHPYRKITEIDSSENNRKADGGLKAAWDHVNATRYEIEGTDSLGKLIITSIIVEDRTSTGRTTQYDADGVISLFQDAEGPEEQIGIGKTPTGFKIGVMRKNNESQITDASTIAEGLLKLKQLKR